MSCSLLRRLDSNERPPGYEPGELPTAPLRDITLLIGYFRIASAKVATFSLSSKFLRRKMQNHMQYFLKRDLDDWISICPKALEIFRKLEQARAI